MMAATATNLNVRVMHVRLIDNPHLTTRSPLISSIEVERHSSRTSNVQVRGSFDHQRQWVGV